MTALYVCRGFVRALNDDNERMIASIKSKTPLIMRLLASSVKISEKAGEVIRSVLLEGDLRTVEKAKNDFLTKADISSQQCIMESFAAQYPNRDFKIIGEEETGKLDPDENQSIELDASSDVLLKECPAAFSDVSAQDVTIWVDPLDGTAEFTQSQNNPELQEHVTVLIGIAVKSDPVAGVIHQPFYHRHGNVKPGRTIWGAIGLGALGGHFAQPTTGGLIVTTSRSHSNEVVNKTVAALDPAEVIRVGGAGHKVLLVLEGKAHAYVFASPGCKKWDTCAPEAILRATGGQLTDLFGNRLQYHSGVKFPNTGGVLATSSGCDHNWYISRTAKEVTDILKP